VSRAQRPSTVVRAAAAVTAAAVAAVCGASASTGAQDPGRILFAGDLAAFRAHESLYTIGIDGRGLRRITTKIDNTLTVQWSPNGERIGFYRNGGFYVVPARGGRPRVVGRVGGDTQFSWSPDGTRLAFFTFGGDRLDVVRIGRKLRVSRFATPGAGDDRPAWSPDGKRIAYVRYRLNEGTGDLCAVDLADGHVSVLLHNAVGSGVTWSPDGRTIAYEYAFNIVLADVARHKRRTLAPGDMPAWSPNGKKIAVTRRGANVYVIDVRTGRSVHVSGYYEADVRLGIDPPSWTPDSRRLVVPVKNDVYIVSADGRTRRAITHNGTSTLLDTVPSLSPDGRRVTYVADPNVAQDDDLYSIRPDGSGLQSVTRNSLWEDQPVWSPDRSRIAFVRLLGLSGDVLVMNADGRDAHVVAKGVHPAWTADGQRLAYDRDGDIYTVSADGGPEHLLIGGPTVDSDPAWSRDGARIAYTRRPAKDTPGDVWTAAADGSGAAQLTRIADTHDHCVPIEAFSPAWSPDGTEIAYVRGVGVTTDCMFHIFSMSIHAIRLDGTADRLITNGGAGGQGGASDPAWSPDGARLVFTISAQYDPREDFIYEVGIVGRDGRGLRVLFGRAHSQDPDWR
jgi:TolB protein